jgi:hypothetical protein
MAIQTRDLDSNLKYVFIQGGANCTDPGVATTYVTQGANIGLGFVPSPGTIKGARVFSNGVTNGPLLTIAVLRGQNQFTIMSGASLGNSSFGVSLIAVGSTGLNVYTNDLIVASVANSGGGTALIANLGIVVAVQLTQDIVTNFAT